MSKFFIERPIFAWVIAIVVMLVGGLSILSLPINQYPNIAPPAISVQVAYPGASAETTQNTVVQVIEQQLNGLDNLRYIESQSNSDGSASIIVTFNQGTDPDIAQVQVQNKVSLAESQLPTEVVNQGINIRKYQANFMLVVGLTSSNPKLSNGDLADLMVSKLQDPIARSNGVGDFMVMGAEYGMRIWLDPAKLYKYQLVPSDITTAISQQNVQVSSGKLAGLPTVSGARFSATIVGKTRLQSVEQFKNILLKVNADGSQVRLRDVGGIDLGPQDYSISSTFNGEPSVGIALRLASGGNVLDAINSVRHTVDGIKPFLPEGVKVNFPYDTAPVVSASIEEVVKTLIEAIVLVFMVMLLFLQNLRATLITTMVVPVVLLGTFGILAACGYTINILTMFGMVLAIGLLVDDAIVVVENVERVMHDEGLDPKAATIKSMQQIQGALLGIALVLSAVLLPMAFFSGSTGVIYRQFSITIVSAMALSVLMAMIFTPALCATLLKATSAEHKTTGMAGWFNRKFDTGTLYYTRGVSRVISKRKLFLVIYVAIIAATGYLFTRVPTSFLPDEDQGVMMVQVTLPANASSGRTQEVLNDIGGWLLKNEPEVKSVFSPNGFSFAGRGENVGMSFVLLKPWDQRNSEQSVQKLAARTMAHFATLKDAKVFALVPPAVMELGNATGFDFFLQDVNNQGHAALMAARNQFLSMAAKDKRLFATRPNGMEDEPQYHLIIDDERARALGLSLEDVNDTLSTAWGSSYVNQFIYNARVKKVYVQGNAGSRVTPEDLDKWYFRNASGDMVPYSAFGSGKWEYGSPRYERFNGASSVEIMGSPAPAPGYSSGDAVKAVNEIAAKLPKGFRVGWHGLSYEEQMSGSQTPALYTISILMVFLCLAALYESWSIPFSVLMVVPMGVLGTILAVLMRGLENDVFFQVGLLTTVGLAAKNAILIVEFAKDLHENQGKGLVEAAIEAAKLRIRPIIMTSMAFVLGVLPLTMSHGAGAGSQHSIGTAVVGGMITATFLAIFFVPMFYVVVAQRFTAKKKPKTEVEEHDA